MITLTDKIITQIDWFSNRTEYMQLVPNYLNNIKWLIAITMIVLNGIDIISWQNYYAQLYII